MVHRDGHGVPGILADTVQNAVDTEDCALAREEVRRMGLDPDKVLHERP